MITRPSLGTIVKESSGIEDEDLDAQQTHLWGGTQQFLLI